MITLLACSTGTVLCLLLFPVLSQIADTPHRHLTLHALNLPHIARRSLFHCLISQISFVFPLHPLLYSPQTYLALGCQFSCLSSSNYSKCAWRGATLTHAFRSYQVIKLKAVTEFQLKWYLENKPNVVLLVMPDFNQSQTLLLLWILSVIRSSFEPQTQQKWMASFRFSHGAITNCQGKLQMHITLNRLYWLLVCLHSLLIGF